MTASYPDKVLSYKTYESIGHFAKSRLGPKDKHISPNIEKSMTFELPNQQSLVIVQEKLDGSNVCVVKKDGKLIALSRNGFDCASSNQIQHLAFNEFMHHYYVTFDRLLQEGDRIVGEWLMLAHGTKYTVAHPLELFVAFDLFSSRYGEARVKISEPPIHCPPLVTRAPFLEFIRRVSPFFRTPHVIHMGGACSVGRAERLMSASHPNYDYEGFVYRIEESGVFKSMAKYVKHDKVDGKYLIGQGEPGFEFTWNFAPNIEKKENND